MFFGTQFSLTTAASEWTAMCEIHFEFAVEQNYCLSNT